MQGGRPKLLLVGGPHVPADIASALGGAFEVTAVTAGEALQAMRDDSGRRFQAVLADTGDFLPLERHLVTEQTSVLLNALGEAVCLCRIDGEVVWGNQRFQHYAPETKGRLQAVCRAAGRWLQEHPTPAGEAMPSRRYDVAAAEDSRFYEVLVSPVEEGVAPDDTGRRVPRHVAAVVWDVTTTRANQRKQAAIDAAGAELVRLDADQILKLHVGERLRVVEEKIVRFAHDILQFDNFTIRLLDERTGKLELVMSKGLPEEAMELELFARAEGNGISGYVAATARSYICTDTQRDPMFVTGMVAARSSVTVPLLLKQKVIGIFNVESAQPNAFNDQDCQFAESFATHVALALHMLNLLVGERITTGQAVTGTMEGELAEPLDDLSALTDKLKAMVGTDPAAQRLIERIVADVDSIRRRVKDVASGPRNILGAERALSDVHIDPALKDKRVLVVDDEPRIRQVIRDVLRARGAEVHIAEDGASAHAILTGQGSTSPSGPGTERAVERAHEGPRPFDLLISDIRLPDQTGYDIFAGARKINPGMPVILMTGFGYDPHHSIVRASQEGLSCVLFKPFQAERLIEEVHKALSKS